jgi:hypothetical protein
MADVAALDRAIECLLDAATDVPDAALAEALLASHPRELAALRVVADVASACRRAQFEGDPAAVAPLFRWGNIDVREFVARGASADVYRARERTLGVDVALKLHRDGPHSPGARRFMDEAQHLARVRQRNVVGVYGAAVHDGRAGLWCEWIEGRSLARILDECGAFAPLEAVHAGIEVCNALEALHGAGMLHGDLKPANVLRERGGRIVLVDLGAGGVPQQVNSATADYGTPAYLPPEVMAGAARTPEHDLYALGRLMQTLLGGGADARSPAVPPPALRRVLARATAADPGQRYARAGQLHDELAFVLGAPTGAPSQRPGKRRRWFAAAVIGAALIVALLLSFLPHSVPPWHADLTLLRRTDGGVAALAQGATLARGDRLLLDLDSDRALHAYVLNEDAAGSLHVLFPLPGLALRNPLAGNHPVRLPGKQDGRELAWEIGSDTQREEFVVVLATAPVAELDRLAGDAAVTPPIERGVSRLRSELPAPARVQGRHLAAILQSIAPLLADPERARVRVYRFNGPPAAGAD